MCLPGGGVSLLEHSAALPLSPDPSMAVLPLCLHSDVLSPTSLSKTTSCIFLPRTHHCLTCIFNLYVPAQVKHSGDNDTGTQDPCWGVMIQENLITWDWAKASNLFVGTSSGGEGEHYQEGDREEFWVIFSVFFQVSWLVHTQIFIIYIFLFLYAWIIYSNKKRVNWRGESINGTDKNCFEKF